MGIFFQSIKIGASPGGPFETVKALVDTGATYTSVPRALLEQLGVRLLERQPFILANGRRVEYDIAQVRVRLDGRERYSVCIFGEESATPLLGTVTLEEFGLAVDPVNKRLKPVAGYLVYLGPQ